MASSSSASLDLKLSLKPSYVPKTIANLLKDLSDLGNASDKLAVLNDYINQHEEELTSIMAFKRQLPQCMLLLIEALGTLKDEYMNIKNGMESENGRPNLMDSLAMKRKHYEAAEQTVLTSAADKYECKGKSLMNLSYRHEPDWDSNCENKKQKTFLDFIQAPNQDPIPSKESNLGLFIAEKGCSSRCASIGTNNGHCGLNLKADNENMNYHPKPLTQPIWKNNRRSWSPELHARFVEALNLLGGIEVATPKQIREVMQVEDLTNDQVKSHLQKYRLHYRRPQENYAECLANVEGPRNNYGYAFASEDSDPEGSLSRRITHA